MEEEPPTPPTPAQPSSPFWLPSTSTRPRHRFRPISSLVFNTSFFVVLLSISAIAFLAVLTPSLISYTSHAFHPKSLKKGWDSANLLLVAFAVVCGFMGRKDGEDRAFVDEEQGHKDTTSTSTTTTPRLARSEQSYSNWYPYGVHASATNVVQLRRSFRSYPDLRQEISWENDMRRPRYFDDSYVDSPRLVVSAESFRSQIVEGDCGADVNNLQVAAKGNLSSKDSPSPPAEPPVSLLPPVADLLIGAEDSQQENQRIRHRGRRRKRLAAKETQSPSTVRIRTPSPPPPPLPEVGQHDSEEESARSTPKKRGGMTKEIISSIYHQSKRKKNQKRRSHENLEDFVLHPNHSRSFLPPSPPPPPPPPPPSFFNNIFASKKVRSGKKSSSAPPPPPLPPRRRSSASHSVANFTNTKTRFTPKTTTSRADFRRINQIAGDGSESPLIPIPPPPPPPPFKFRSWKFAVEGDYVNIAISPKSGGGDSEMEDSDSNTQMATGNTQPPFCPSPDVNHKADDFIARFRSNLKLEKMNSIKQKKMTGIGFSPLGPESSPSPT